MRNVVYDVILVGSERHGAGGMRRCGTRPFLGDIHQNTAQNPANIGVRILQRHVGKQMHQGAIGTPDAILVRQGTAVLRNAENLSLEPQPVFGVHHIDERAQGRRFLKTQKLQRQWRKFATFFTKVPAKRGQTAEIADIGHQGCLLQNSHVVPLTTSGRHVIMGKHQLKKGQLSQLTTKMHTSVARLEITIIV